MWMLMNQRFSKLILPLDILRQGAMTLTSRPCGDLVRKRTRCHGNIWVVFSYPQDPSGNLIWLLKMAIDSGSTNGTWPFSIAI